MKLRSRYIIHSFLSLTVGLAVYIFLRKGTYIHQILKLSNVTNLNVSFQGDIFIKYHLPDFLWGYSLAMALYSVLMPKKSSYIIAATTSAFGTLFEVLQYLKVISGTFDFIDCIMYVLAAIISNIIYKIGVTKNEKTN